MENYEKKSIIGRGAYGTVFLCKKEFILKEIPMEAVNDEERATALNEVQILKVLNHPNIVLYIDSKLEKQALLIVMEYVNGGNLHDFLLTQTAKLDEEVVMNFFIQIIVALNHIHSKNVLHRDLKTQNLLIDRHHKILKISDFGISKVLSSKSKAMSVVGTPCYISPEVCEHSPYNKGQKSDIWAVGCILYELMTLKRAFEAGNLPALVTKIMRADYQPPPPKYSSQARSLVSKCLSLEPYRRPNTSQLLCEPVIHKQMLLLYADIGSYTPSFKQPTVPSKPPKIVKYNQMSLSSLSGRESAVYLWGDGHIAPTELDKDAIGFVASVALGAGTRACLTNQSALFHWDASVDVNGLPSYTPRRLGESKFKCVSAGQGFIAAITSKGVLVIARAPSFDIEIIESLLGIDCAACAAGEKALFVLSVEGECWHVFDDFQTRTVRPRALTLPRPVKPVTLLAGVDAAAVTTNDGACFVYGRNTDNRLLLGEHVNEANKFVEVAHDINVAKMVIGPTHSAIVTQTNELFMVGNNKYGALGDSFSGHTDGLVARKVADNLAVLNVACGPHYTCVICDDGSVWTWGRGTRGQLGRNPEPQDSPRQVLLQPGNAKTVALDVATYDGITLLSTRK